MLIAESDKFGFKIGKYNTSKSNNNSSIVFIFR